MLTELISIDTDTLPLEVPYTGPTRRQTVAVFFFSTAM
jgi:hypothetical protein